MIKKETLEIIITGQIDGSPKYGFGYVNGSLLGLGGTNVIGSGYDSASAKAEKIEQNGVKVVLSVFGQHNNTFSAKVYVEVVYQAFG